MTALTIPVLETDRMRLRGPVMADLPAYAAFLASPRSIPTGGPYPAEEAFTKLATIAGHWVLRGYGRWVVADRVTDEALGIVGLIHQDWKPETELGWTLFSREGEGMAYEAALAARHYAAQVLCFPRLMSLCAADNPRSVALAKRLGCTLDGQIDHPRAGPIDVWRHPAEVA